MSARCTGPGCAQGRKPCPTPEACHVHVGATDHDTVDALLAVFGWVLTVIVVAMAAVMVTFL